MGKIYIKLDGNLVPVSLDTTISKEEETKTVTPNFASGNVVVTPTSGKVLSQVTFSKDTTNHIAGNIKKDITLYGVTGTYEGGGGIEGGYNVSFKVDNQDYSVISVVAGKSIEAPFDPIVSGKVFTGWYDGANKISFPYIPSGDITLNAGLVTAETCTVAGLGSSSPSNVIFTKSSGWSDTYETILKDGDTFKKFPIMYRKVNTAASGQITGYTISTGKIDNTYLPYPCFLDESGNELPYVLMGVSYSNSDSSCNSIAGYTGSTTQEIDVGRANARARGTGYQQMDWMVFKLWQDLLCCAMETVNTNSGSGITTDALGIYCGGKFVWIDGITHNGYTKNFVFSYKPTKYINEASTSSDGYQATSYTYYATSNEAEISKLGYDSSNPFINYPAYTINNSSYNSYYCDKFDFETSGTRPVYTNVGGAYTHYGAFCCMADLSWMSVATVRLCYRPISE